ncbi:MAG: hypothetical protein H0V70_09230 [Ktedonobacteraceae bacterium]|nr:hypothetical protein [Ktedonobacteraceae bacterium]
MDIPTTMTPIQLSLIWLLMGLLLTWMIVFALLALRPERGKKIEPEPSSASNSSFPQLHVIVQQQAERPTANIQLDSTATSASGSGR